MNSINKKILDKICSDRDFALGIYEQLSLKPFDTFFEQEYIEDMIINNEDDLFFIAHKCNHKDLLEKMWNEDKTIIKHHILSMSDKTIAMKLCKFSMMSEDNELSSLCFSLKNIFSVLPSERISLLKFEIIQHFVKMSDNDIFPILINNNILNIRDFINFSKTSKDRNETIVNILNNYNKINISDVEEKITELEYYFKQESEGLKIGKNIQIKNSIASLITLLKINQEEIVLSTKQFDFLLKISRYFNNTLLFSLLNKIKLTKVFNNEYENNKILKKRL